MKKQVVRAVFLLCMLLSFIATGVLAAENTTEFDGGEGTEASPYLIATAEHLNNVRNHLSSHFKLTNNILFTEEDFAEDGDFYNNGEGFIPIGSYDAPFTGSFDGSGYTIAGLYVNPTPKGSDLCAALFYRVQNATIQNLGMVNARMNAAYGSYTDTYCSYSGTIAAFATSSAITNCYSTGSVSATMRYSHATAYAGGLVAIMDEGGALSGCYNAAAVYGKTRAGGLVGYQKSESDQTTISNCFNIGSVSGANLVGGIAGYTDNKKCTVECCYNIGAVSSTSINRACGIVGDVPYYGNTNLFYCYYLDNCSRPVGSGTIDYTVCRYTRDAMLKESSFEGFDFTNIWTMDGHPDYFYPTLRDAKMIYTRTLDSISVSSLPDQTMYHIGGTISTEGLVVTALYDNGLTETVTDYELSYDLSAAGEATVTVTYEGMTATFTVNVYMNAFQDGFGTEESPYLIATAEQLNHVRNYLSSHFKMTADIVFTDADFAEGGAFYNEGKGWQPIGEDDSVANPPFTGVFDGDGHTITGLQIHHDETSSNSHIGLFGILRGTVCNLGMVDTKVTCTAPVSSREIGSIAGRLDGGSVINCYNTGSVSVDIGTASYGYFGGLAGRTLGDSKILNCYNIASVYTIGRGDFYTGGIAGLVVDTNIKDCFNFGSVDIQNIYESDVGGIAGRLASSTISNCYNAAVSVSVERKPAPGTSDSWATHEYDVGGIAGSASSSTVIENCYYLNNCSVGIDNTTTDSCVKCTAEQMQREDTFLGFDFDSVWTMGGHREYLYPELRGTDMIFTKCLTGISIVSPPEKLVYDTDSRLDPSGLSVVAFYNNGTAVDLTDYELSYDFSTTGVKKVTVSYGEYSDTFSVRVCIPGFDGGFGTEESPYLISTKQQLDAVRKDTGAHYKLIADILFTEADFAEGGEFRNGGTGFAPIRWFTGSFDGNGHKISNLYIRPGSPTVTYAGLFEQVQDAFICNLELENIQIDVTSSRAISVGGVAGSAVNTPIINCFCSGSIVGRSAVAASYTGGIVGQTDSEVRGCRNTASVTGSGRVGGIAGKLTGSIVSCYHTGIVTGGNYAGAIVGECANGSITACCYLAATGVNSIAGAGCGCSDHELFAIQDFSTGEAAYHLNEALSAETGYWYQTIGEDPLPVLDSTHAWVYRYQSGGCSEASYTYAYSNQKKNAVTTHSFQWEHTPDSHWQACIDCGDSLPAEAHRDVSGDHICDLCKVTVSICQDSTNDHICDLCRKVCSSCVDENSDHACDICSAVLSECTDNDHQHSCDICGKVISECFDSADDTDHRCDSCGKVLSECADGNSDHRCDICNAVVSPCEDNNRDHACDLCGAAVSVCSDASKDHMCDVCGAQLSVCQDDDDDSLCDICGADLSVPILISNAAELAKIGVEKDYPMNGFYCLTGNIDLSDHGNWTPIGTGEAPFTGTFDGNGHIITGLQIHSDSASADVLYAGLFGHTCGVIENLGLADAEIIVKDNAGAAYAGGIAGYNAGSISGCYSTGSVSLNNHASDSSGSGHIGGIAGYSAASISDCFNVSEVSASGTNLPLYAGGITGYSKGTMSSCYNIGTVAAESAGGSSFGGVAGYAYPRATNCYSLDLSAAYAGGGAKNCTMAEMKQTATYYGFDFTDVWTMSGVDNYPYPELQGVELRYTPTLLSLSVSSLPRTLYYDVGEMLDPAGMKVIAYYNNDSTKTVTDYRLSYDFSAAGEATVTVTFEGKTADFKVCVNDGLFSGGLGTGQYPYLIGSAEELDQIRSAPSRCYRLITDIVFSQDDFSRGGAFYNGGTGWEPIGKSGTPFTGTLDGDGHTISGLYINQSEAAVDVYAGLFGITDGATICDLTLRNVDITVDSDAVSCVGGMVGCARNTEIESCHITGTILSRGIEDARAGGIAGYSSRGTISHCSNASAVIAESNHPKGLSDYYAYAGGILGYGLSSDISACYNIGSVTAESLKSVAYAGGILGETCLSIINCFNAGTVTAKAYDDGYKYFQNAAYAGGISAVGGDTITCCYNVGDVFASSAPDTDTEIMVRGITCYASWPKQISNCYYIDSLPYGVNTSTSYPDTSVRCTRWQMTEASTFRGFDFGSVWTMGDSPEYPYPVLRGVEMVSTSLNTSKTDDGVRVALNLMDGLTADEVYLLVAAYDRDGQMCGEAKVYTADALRAFMNGGKEITFSSHHSCGVFLTDLNFKPLLEADFVQ